MRFQLLSQEQPRAMHTRRDIVDGEVEDRRDVPRREPLDVAQQHDCAVVGGQFIDGGTEHYPKLDLASRVVDAQRPVGDRRDVAAVLTDLQIAQDGGPETRLHARLERGQRREAAVVHCPPAA